MSRYWCKLHHELLDDPKVQLLPVNLRWRFIELLLLASEYDDEGWLPDVRVMAWRLRSDPQTLEHDLSQLAAVGITRYDHHDEDTDRWLLVNYTKRQAPATPAERKRRQRARERGAVSPLASPLQENTDTYIELEDVTHFVTKGVTNSSRFRDSKVTKIINIFQKRGYMPSQSSFETKWERPIKDWMERVGDTDQLAALVNEAIDLAVTKGYTVAAPSSLSTIMANLMAGKNSRGQTRAALEGWNEVKAAWRHRTPEDQLPADVQSVIKLMGGLAAVGQMREVEAKQQFTTLWGTS